MMRSALRARWLRGALIALLLFAQHGALTHALVHAGWHAHAATAHDNGHADRPVEGAPADTVAEQCALDLVYNQVLGGVHTGHSVVFAAVEQILVVVAALTVRNSVTVVPYDSRGPPVLS